MNQRIYYVGKKPAKKDTLAKTGVVWNGFGDSKLVDEAAAQNLLKYPDVWMSEDKFLAAHTTTEAADCDESNVHPEPATAGLQIVEDPNKVIPPAKSTNPTALIQEAIRQLDRTNKDHFAGTGAPKIDAVRKVLGADFELDKKALDAAFAEIKEEFRA